jgi:hypothetical protein
MTVRHGCLGAVKPVFGWAVANNLIEKNPVSGVRVAVPRRVRTRSEKGYTDAEAKIVLEASLAINCQDDPSFLAFAKRWLPWLGGDYRAAQAWLTDKGYFELSSEEYDCADELAETPMGRTWRLGPDAMKEAARALMHNASAVGVKIIGDVPFRYWDMWIWEDWFVGRR